jgi:hypothetical protein
MLDMKPLYRLIPLLIALLPITASAETFIRSIEYAVSTDQTLNEARKNALSQIKIDVLSEVGALVESEIKSSSNGRQTTETVNYSQISAGVVKLKTLNELYDGKTLFIEAETDVNTKDVVELINTIYNVKQKDNRLSALIKEHARIQKDKEVIAAENNLLQIKLNAMKKQIAFIEKSSTEANSNYDKLHNISKKLNTIKSRIKSRVKIENKNFNELYDLTYSLYIDGMTIDEFRSVIPAEEIRSFYHAHRGRYNNVAIVEVFSKGFDKAYVIATKSVDGMDRVLFIEASSSGKVGTPQSQ